MRRLIVATNTPDVSSNNTKKSRSDFAKRSLVAIPGLFLLSSVIYFQGSYAKIVVTLIHILCVREILNAASSLAKPIRGLSYGFALTLLPAYEFLGGQAGVSLLLLCTVMLTFIVLMVRGRTLTDGFYTILPMIYPGMLFSSVFDILYIPNQQISQFLLIITFGCAVVTDTFAYLGGSICGRHKLIERVSPNKTVAGGLCGLFCGTLFVVITSLCLQSTFGVIWSTNSYIIIGVLFSLFAQIGDLIASYLKRWFGIKDFGSIWGPHGGMLDRLDSMLFLAPVASIFYLIHLL